MVFSVTALRTSVLAVIAMLLLASFPLPSLAAALLNKSDTMSTVKASTVADHTIVFRTPTGAAESTDTITVVFPSGWTMNSLDFADLDLAHSAGSQANCTSPTYTNDETLAATPSATAWGAALSSQTITFTAPTDGVGAAAIAANACVQIQIGTNATTGGTGNTQITNTASTGNATIAIGGTFGDSGDIVVTVLSDDQVAVTATVDESLTFTISDNTIEFGTLTASDDFFADDSGGNATEVEAHTIVVGTNAANGYSVTVTGSTLSLNGAGVTTITAIGSSNTASSTGSEQFGLRMTASGGSGAVSAPYAASGFALDTAAFPDEVAASTGTSANTTYSVRYLANIASSTEAGAYSTTLTYTATAQF